MQAFTEDRIAALAGKIAADVAKNAGTVVQLCYAPALFALQDALETHEGFWKLTDEDGTVSYTDRWDVAKHHPNATQQGSFQSRVKPWMLECFGQAISDDLVERNHRFLEEALELVQSTGCTQGEAHELVDYVFGRPVGEPEQEVGGVMVTLAALCLAAKMDMHAAGDKELARVWTKVEQIRAKQAAKPKFSALPIPQKMESYRQAIDDEMVNTHIGVSTGNAKADLARVIEWHVGVALDPAVSDRAPVQAAGALNRIRQALRARDMNDFVGNDAELLESAANVIAEDGFVRRHMPRVIQTLNPADGLPVFELKYPASPAVADNRTRLPLADPGSEFEGAAFDTYAKTVRHFESRADAWNAWHARAALCQLAEESQPVGEVLSYDPINMHAVIQWHPAQNGHPPAGFNVGSKLYTLPPAADKIEALAQAVYEQWKDMPGYKPWQAGGNSDKQVEVRAIVRAAMAAKDKP
ncbi:hypothetical protein [Herbaspirillum huttiense]|uniref:Uncharacterized protein n=1 Tax=Herbaspirillum huttiense subsp. lycopersici TaxID=3074428 RepID=A0ABU2EGS7_9BURK|nr:hypothetical protein [Herbaspirillum huttiense]MDR9847077.1 hypothetical protein [Herbaspirillum huttiense SE1]